MPAVLHILTPNGQHKCAGEYTPVAGETANGHPVWRQSAGPFWLYSGVKGMWIIGSSEAREKNFQCSHGSIFCRVLHKGAMPDKVNGTWSRLEGDGFIEDADIQITTAIAKPFSLRIVSPNGQQKCAGEYQLVVGEMAHGLPLWRQRGGKCWLYTGSNGMWIVGSTDAKEQNFNCTRGVLCSKIPHGGLMPDRVGCVWMRLSGETFHEDSSITVAIKPAPLYLQSPNGQQRCAGEFVPVADKMANGQPFWEHIGGKCWLYSGVNGMWIVGGADAKAKNFQCTRGVIYCKTAHGGMMPDKLAGNWMRLDGESFREDAAISVSMKPSTLYVMSPLGQHRVAGEYRLVPGENVHGQPVWKQRKGHCRIFSSRGGSWQIASAEGKDGDFQHAEIALRCDADHQGAMPNKTSYVWSRLEGETFEEDHTVRITTVRNKPAKLHVKSPNGQQRCAGEYVLVAGATANGQPLWRQMGGRYWLYSGTNGMWIFGSSGAKDKNFDCSRGVVYSLTPHGGVMPDKLKSLWLRLDGEAFHEDAAIVVESDHVTSRKRTAAAAGIGEKPEAAA